MFRLVVALGLFIGYASSSVAADYEVNLSVLDNLEGVADNGFELPLPAAKEKNAVSAAKKISPDKFKKNSVQKKSVKAEKPKSKKAETEDKQVSTDETSKEKNDEKREVSKVGESSAMLYFPDSSAELNAEITDVLTLFLNKIDLQNQEKITIEAYNYNEEDSGFARKRLSLNRAVAVRGWLLAKGLKSFSVKIINTEDASFQNNVLVSY